MSSQQEEKGSLMYRLGDTFAGFVRNFFPDALVFAIALSIVVFVCGLLLTPSGPFDMVVHWGNGVWDILAFSMQVASTLVLSHIVANTRQVSAILNRIASIPKTPSGAVMMACVVTMICSLLSWGFGLIMGAIFARAVARNVKGIDYGFLVACAYIGFMIWHAGLSGSIPLLLATQGGVTYNILGHVIPITYTTLSPLNITLTIFFLITLPFVVRFMLPPASKVKEIDPALLEETSVEIKMPENPTVAQRMEYGRFFSTLLGVVFAIWLVQHFANRGLAGIDLNSVNLTFFTVGLLLVSSPMEYVHRTRIAAAGAGNLMVQFPLYAGIMGMSVGSGLADVFSNFFISFATAETLPNFIHLSSSFLNMFIPSAGGKFVVEAPIYLPAAEALGANVNYVAVAALWGDGLTNLIQPFWALPLLAIAKLGIRDIMGYCMVATIYGLIFQQIFIYVFSVLL